MSDVSINGLSNIATVRIDKWLWYARFFKTRSLATKFVTSGKLRIDGDVVSKPHRQIKKGQVLTFPLGNNIRIIQIADFGGRRGPAPEAQALYEDLAPPAPRGLNKGDVGNNLGFERRERGTGRPTKRERRETSRLKDPLGEA
tara:strand:+ start:247 stop:675 length:429 start_codon:yes stop_codon:yes gene_type:complete